MGPSDPCLSRSAFGGTEGFTLVEVLVAVVILSVGIVAILQAFHHSLSVLGESRDCLRSSHLLAEKLSETELGALAGNAPESSNGEFGGLNNRYRWDCRVVPEMSVMPAGTTSLDRVTVTVWRSGSSRRYAAETCIRSRKAGAP